MEDFANNILGYLLIRGMSEKEFAASVGFDKSTVNKWVKLERVTSAANRLAVAEALGELPLKFTSATFGYFAEAIDRVRNANGDVSAAGFPRKDERLWQLFSRRAEEMGGGLVGEKVEAWLPLVRFGHGSAGRGLPEPVEKVPVTLQLRDTHPHAVVVEANPADEAAEALLGNALVYVEVGLEPPRNRMVTTLLRAPEGVGLARATFHAGALSTADPHLVLRGGVPMREEATLSPREVEVVGTAFLVCSAGGHAPPG